MKNELTHARLLELVRYDPLTGVFRAAFKRGKWAADRVLGSREPSGYVKLYLDAQCYYAHRVAWFYVHGTWPPRGLQIDHINRVRDDNRLLNLRVVSSRVNLLNTARTRMSDRFRDQLLAADPDTASRMFSLWFAAGGEEASDG